MRIIAKPIRAGKTTELIKLSAIKDCYIVCFNRQEAMRVFEQSKNMGLKIPFPMTFDELMDREYYGKGVKQIAIDNVEMLIEYIASELRVEAITVTK